MADPQKLVDMGFNVAILGAFACGPAGAVAAVPIGALQFFFDWFCPAAQSPTQFAAVDNATLDLALQDLVSQMTDVAWHTELDKQTHDVLTLAEKFRDMVRDLQDLELDPKTYVALNDQTVDNCNEFFKLGAAGITDALSVLRDARKQITLSSSNDASLSDLQVAEHYTKTTGLYCLIAGLTTAYLKNAVIWLRAQHVLPHLRYQKYLKDKADWDKNPNKAAHPSWEPKKVDEPAEDLIPWEDWIKTGAAQTLIEEVDQLVAEAEGTPEIPDTPLRKGHPATKGLQVKMAENWKTMFKNVSARVKKLSIQSRPPASPKDGPCYWVYDSETDYSSHPLQSQELANMRMKIRRGMLIAYEWEQSMKEFALSGVQEEDIKTFGDAIPLWKAASASIQFSNYEVQSGDSLQSIAQAQYKDGSLWERIFHFNRDVMKLPTDIGEGLILKIPDQKVLSWIE